MIKNLNVKDGEVSAEEIDYDANEMVDDIMCIIDILFNSFINDIKSNDIESKNEVTKKLKYGWLCRQLVDNIKGSL